jgi:hypothetical protein
LSADTEGVEVCGAGKVAVDSSDPLAPSQYVGALTQGTAVRWLSAMQDSSDLRARVAGLLLESKVDEPGHPLAEGTRDALVQLAVGAGDPAVYAMAVYACGTYFNAPAGACERISLQGWAQRDADNAVPWLLLAGKAHGHDNVAETYAFARAANAEKVDAYNDSLYAFSESEMPKVATPLDRFYLATEVLGLESAITTPQYSIAGRYCSLDAIQEADVRQQCNSLAELLVTKGTTFLDLGEGEAIGARAGWPKDRLTDLKQKRYALMQVITQAWPTGPDDQWSCDGVRRGNDYMDQRDRLGELGAAREALERSDDTVPALAQKHMQSVDTLLRDASRRVQEQQKHEQAVSPGP